MLGVPEIREVDLVPEDYDDQDEGHDRGSDDQDDWSSRWPIGPPYEDEPYGWTEGDLRDLVRGIGEDMPYGLTEEDIRDLLWDPTTADLQLHNGDARDAYVKYWIQYKEFKVRKFKKYIEKVFSHPPSTC